MAYIVKKKNREGKYYVYLVEGYREGDKVRQRTLKNYGSLEALESKELGAFERLRMEAKKGIIGREETKNIVVSFDLNDEIDSENLYYGWKILDNLYESLGIGTVTNKNKRKGTQIDKNLDKVLKLLVFQRILNPNSKISTLHSQKNMFGDWSISENTMYRSLRRISSIKEDIQLAVHNAISNTVGREARIVFYDVTNYYFEVNIDDEDVFNEDGELVEEGIRRRGPSKEHRPKPIVQLGLFMDTNGIPICYKLFRGNQTDPITYLPALEQIKKQFGLDRLVVVADKAMNSKLNVTKNFINGDGWLFSQKHRGTKGSPKDIQEFILDPNGWQFNESMTFASKSMIRERKLNSNNICREKVVVTWNKKYADREKIRRDGAIEYAQKLTDAQLFRQTCKRGGKKYLEITFVDKQTGEIRPYSPCIQINEDKVEFDAQFDGINVLVTSEVNLSDEEILSRYRELSVIEDCFRVTKTEFEARPVFVRKRDHIEAHFFTCFIALVLLRIIQVRINRSMSAERIINALNSAICNNISQGYYRVQANDDLREILQLLCINWENKYVRSEEISKFGEGWFTTK